MSKVNIGQHHKNDKHHRYTMEPLQLKSDRSGRTILMNLEKTAQDLEIPAIYILKFFGYEIGSQASFDEKRNQYVIKGSLDSRTASKLLEAFIAKFILCSVCNLPELDYSVVGNGKKKEQQVLQRCMSCGNQRKVPPEEKLHKFMLAKPPPPSAKAKSFATATVDAFASSFSSSAAAPMATTATTTTTTVNDDDEQGIWVSDLSDDAVHKRASEESLLFAQTTDSIDLHSNSEEALMATTATSPTQVLQEYLKLNPGATDASIIMVAQKIKADFNIQTTSVIQVLTEVLFSSTDVIKLIPKRSKIFTAFFKELKQQSRNHAEAFIIYHVEELVSNNMEQLLKQVPRILEALYDTDLVTEETILKWHREQTKKSQNAAAIKQAAFPFIKWLQEAEHED